MQSLASLRGKVGGPVDWNQFFYPRTSAVRLAVLRMILPVVTLLFFLPPTEKLLGYTDGRWYVDPQPLLYALSEVFTQEVTRSATAVKLVLGMTWVTGIMAALGVASRLSGALFAAGYALLFMHDFSFGEYHHDDAVLCVFLVLMAMSPAGRCLSLDSLLIRRRRGWSITEAAGHGWGPQATFSTAMWAIRVTQVMLALAYLSAAVSKLQHGLHWMNGYTLQTYLLADGLRRDRPLGVWLANYRWLCVALSVMTVAAELLFVTILFRPMRRWVPVFLAVMASMHLGIYLAQAATFFQFIALYCLWVPFERWRSMKRLLGAAE